MWVALIRRRQYRFRMKSRPDLRWTAVALVPMALVLVALPASAAEFKLVFEPEPGTTAPARVCLVSRAAQMRALAVPGVEPLAAHADCADPAAVSCPVRRGPPGRGCGRCPDAGPHPDCRARVRTGRFPVDAWSVVCADDSTQPADGGTVYIVAESVEAESPPAVFSLEVDGGRVRWSPLNRVSRPSYTVIGGDFEPSGLSYPRGDAAPAWVTVPLRRRCRCLSHRQPLDASPIERIEVDGEETCHDDTGAGGVLQVEVPAAASGDLRSVRLRTAESEAETRWRTRWPSLETPPRLVQFRFELGPSCERPNPATCPEVSAPWSTCDRPLPVEGACRYTCTTDPGSLVSLPVDLELRSRAPEMAWTQVLRAPGQRLPGGPPPERRVLTLRIPPGPRDAPGDHLGGLALSQPSGEARHVLLDGGPEAHVPMPGLQCGDAFLAYYVGARPFIPALVRVGPGGAVEMPAPEDTAHKVTIGVSGFMGYGVKGSLEPSLDRMLYNDGVMTVGMAAELSYQPFARPWFIRSVVGVEFAPDGMLIAGAEGSNGRRFYIGRDQASLLLSMSVLFGWVWSAFDGVIEVHGGPGVGPKLFIGEETGSQVRSVLLTVGMRRPLGTHLTDWSLCLDVRGSLDVHTPSVVRVAQDLDDESAPDPAELVILGFETGETRTSWRLVTLLGVAHRF